MEQIKADRIVAITVDVQNDFLPGGSLAVTSGDAVIAPLNTLNNYVRRQNGTVVFTGDQHPAITPHFGPDAWPVHCVAGTEGAALSTALQVEPADTIIDKGMGQTDGYSGFEGVTRDGRTLEQIVQPVDHERVIALIGGLATDFCVLNTALDNLKVDPKDGTLTVMILRDAVRAVNLQPEDGEAALAKMQAAGAILTDTVEVVTGNAFELAQ